MAKKAAKKEIRITFVTTEKGLAQQVVRAIKAVPKVSPHRPKGVRLSEGWSQDGGWLLDNGPSGPWGQQGGWTQGSDRVKLPRRGSKVKPAGSKKKTVRGALRNARHR